MDITRLRCGVRLDKRMKEFEHLIQVFRIKKNEEEKKQRGTASECTPNQSLMKEVIRFRSFRNAA